MKYKIGDRIKNIGNVGQNSGKEGIITDIRIASYMYSPSYFLPQEIVVRYDDGCEGQCLVSEAKDSYQIINNKKTIMKKLSNFYKKLVDADTQVLVKAGYLNGDLEPTDKAEAAIGEILFFIHKAELIERAKVEIAEDEAKSL